MRVARIRYAVPALLAAPLAALTAALVAACSGGGQPTPTPSASSATAQPTPSPSPTSTAAALARVPVRQVPECATVACTALAIAPDVRPDISIALVRGPDASDASSETAYVLAVDPTGKRLGSLRLRQGQFFFDSLPQNPPMLSCDVLVHCFVQAGSGAHTGIMNAVGVAESGKLTDLSQGGVLSVDTPDIEPKDIDGDGVDEILGRVNDYTPNYAGGSDYWMVWTWTGSRYAPTGCRKVQPGEDKPGGPVTLSGCPRF